MSAATGRDTALMLTLAPPRGQHGAVLLHAAGGGVSPYFGPASSLAERGGVHAIRAAGLLPGEEPDDDLPTMVRRYVPILDGLARPPTLLFGWSMGGVLAWELAAVLATRGQRPAVVLVDSPSLPVPTDPAQRGAITASLGALSHGQHEQRAAAVVDAHMRANERHRLTTRYDGPTLLIHCAGDDQFVGRWHELAPTLRTRSVHCGHFEVFEPPNDETVMRHVNEFLDDHA